MHKLAIYSEPLFDAVRRYVLHNISANRWKWFCHLDKVKLAVVVDDHRQGITDVIRGNDLFHSAALQSQLYEALGWNIPTWWHLPLVLGADKKRLAKRHGDSRLETFRNEGIPPERIIGLIATWCNIQDNLTPMNAITFCKELDVPSIPKKNKIFTQKEKQWLFDF